MPPATRVIVLKRRVWVALRPGFVAAAMLLALAPQGAPAAPLDLFSFSPAAPFTSEQVTFASTYNERHRIADMGPRRRPALRRRHGPDGQVVLLAGRRLCGHALHQRGASNATSTQRFTVQNRPPAAAITYAPLSPKSGDSVSLASTSADPDGPLVSQDWDLDGDGGFDDWSGPTASVTFSDAGNHQIGLRVTDRDGAASATAVTIAVQEPPVHALSPFPVVRIVGSFGTPGIRIEQLVITGAERSAHRDPVPRPRLSVQEAGPQGAAADGARAPFRAADPAPRRGRAGVGHEAGRDREVHAAADQEGAAADPRGPLPDAGVEAARRRARPSGVR